VAKVANHCGSDSFLLLLAIVANRATPVIVIFNIPVDVKPLDNKFTST
jgi:hypothetical protein